jgi:hypothetical protein
MHSFLVHFYNLVTSLLQLGCPTTRHEGAWGERRYSSYSFSTSALDGGEWSASRPGRALAPEKGLPVSVVQEAEWAPEPVWTQRLLSSVSIKNINNFKSDFIMKW